MSPTTRLKLFILDEAGPTTTEYAVMLALIIVISITAISGIGTTLDTIFTNLDSSLPTGTAS